jgi:hypothetical protein
MKAALLFLSLLALPLCGFADDKQPSAGRLPAGCEVVMSPKMRITATTSVGTIAITAVDELTRSYAWEGATRAVEMSPRTERWYGSLGLFNPGPGDHWREHRGISRCVTQEGQQHFKTAEEALEWIKKRAWWPFVYRDDGLMVGWNKNLPRRQLGVEVWQIIVDGKKPKALPGSQNDKIIVETVETETVPLVKAVASNDLMAATALLAKGADANVKSSLETPVLVIAIKRGSASMVEALLKRGADPNVRDVDTDLTPLWDALGQYDRGRPNIVKMLLTAGADVNATSRKEDDLLTGFTLLMAVAEDGSEELVQLFLDNGADVNAKTPDGQTALSCARLSESKDNQGVIRKLEAAAKK